MPFKNVHRAHLHERMCAALSGELHSLHPEHTMVVEHTFLLILQALCLALAASGLAVADWALSQPLRWRTQVMQWASHGTLAALAVLWTSALLTVWQDVALDPQTALLSRKALISVVLAALLSLNGVFMLRGLQDTLRSGPPDMKPILGRASTLAQACGAVWLVAAYFAASQPLTGQWALSGLALALAALLVMVGLQVRRALAPAPRSTVAWDAQA